MTSAAVNLAAEGETTELPLQSAARRSRPGTGCGSPSPPRSFNPWPLPQLAPLEITSAVPGCPAYRPMCAAQPPEGRLVETAPAGRPGHGVPLDGRHRARRAVGNHREHPLDDHVPAEGWSISESHERSVMP